VRIGFSENKNVPLKIAKALLCRLGKALRFPRVCGSLFKTVCT
jgi:hypothetical protein